MSDENLDLLDWMAKHYAHCRQMTEPDFRQYLEENEYQYVRKLDDGTWIGLTNMLFTTALCVGLDYWGYQRRYDYEDKTLALAELVKMQRGDEIPAGWIAKRPQ